MIVFYAFDLLYIEGRDLTQCPLIEQKAAFKRILPSRDTGRLRYTEHIIEEGDEL